MPARSARSGPARRRRSLPRPDRRAVRRPGRGQRPRRQARRPPGRGVTVAKLLPLLLLVAVGIWFVNPEYIRLAGVAGGIGGRRDRHRADLRVRRPGDRAGAERRSPRSGAHRPARALLRARDHDDALSADSDGGARTARPVDVRPMRRRRWPKRRRACSAAAAVCWCWPAPRFSMFGYVSGDMLGSPRALFAFARDGSCLRRSRASTRASTRRTSPARPLGHRRHAAITGTFAELAILANVAALTLYLMCAWRPINCSGAMSEPAARRSRFRPAAGSARGGRVILWLLSQATRESSW